MKEVLCIAFSCPPILDAQSILLAKMLRPLQAQGYRLRIIGLDPGTCIGSTDESLSDLLPPDAEVLRVAASERRLWYRAVNRWFPSLVRLPDRHLQVLRRAVRAGKALQAARPADLLFSWAQYHTCSLVALRLKKALGLPWVAHFSDPWYGHPYLRPRAYARWINSRLEKAVITGADAVVFVNEETRDWTMSRYPRSWKAKTRVIPHCFDPGLYPATPGRQAGMVFRHLGQFYGDRGPVSLLEAIARLRVSDAGILDDVRFELIGRVEADHVDSMRRTGVDKWVTVRPGVGYQDSLREMTGADVLLLVEAPAVVNLFLPSKLIDYLGAGRPIVALTPARGPAARLLAGTGDRVVSPDDVAGIAEALREAIQEFRRGSPARVVRSPESTSAYRCDTTTRDLAALFEEVAHAERP